MPRKPQVAVEIGIWLEEPMCDGGEGVLERKNQDVVGAWVLKAKGKAVGKALMMMSWGN